MCVCTPRRDVKGEAKAILETTRHSLGNFLNYPEKIPNLTLMRQALFCAIRELSCRVLRNTAQQSVYLKSPQAVENYARVLIKDKDKECFLVLFLDKNAGTLKADTLHTGTVDHVYTYAREIAESALLYHASSVILAHNHPSGNALPSGEDLALTRRVQSALNVLDIKLNDHLIITPSGFYSMAREGDL